MYSPECMQETFDQFWLYWLGHLLHRIHLNTQSSYIFHHNLKCIFQTWILCGSCGLSGNVYQSATTQQIISQYHSILKLNNVIYEVMEVYMKLIDASLQFTTLCTWRSWRCWTCLKRSRRCTASLLRKLHTSTDRSPAGSTSWSLTRYLSTTNTAFHKLLPTLC